MAGWSNKTVLVTGAGGFIGSHLAERLVREGARTRALVHYNSLDRRGWLDQSELAGEMEIIPGDLCDRDSVHEAARGAEVIFHLGALIAIPYSYQAPASYIRVNVEGTLNVLQAARAHEAQALVHTSTSEVYGTARYVPIDEKHPLQGQSPYSASKIGADKLAESFHLSFGLPVVTARPFNTYGPRQSARAVIPTIVSQFLKNKSARLGNLTPTRDLNFVENTVDGFLLAGRSEKAVGRTVNLGSGKEISIGDLVNLIAEIMGLAPEVETESQRMRPTGSEVDRLLADNALARELLGWEPRVGLRQGLTRTIAWIEENMHIYRPDRYTV